MLQGLLVCECGSVLTRGQQMALAAQHGSATNRVVDRRNL